jgi:hypothetical protein
VLTVSPNNAPLHAYDDMVHDLLAQLDTIENEGDQEVRNVREVDMALEDLEQKLSSQAPSHGDVVKVYDVEQEM